MKLDRCNAQAFSEEDLLRAENEFLQDELELREQEHTLEIYETILDCIEKEGSVSSSIETMFGENFSSSANALNELNDILSQSYEGMFDKIRELTASGRDTILNGQANALVKELTAAKANLDKVSYPVTIENGAKVNVLMQVEKYADEIYKDIMELKKANVMELSQKLRAFRAKYEGIAKIFNASTEDKENGPKFQNVTCNSAAELGSEVDKVITGIKKYPTLAGKFKKCLEVTQGMMSLNGVMRDFDNRNPERQDAYKKDIEELQLFVALHKRFCFMGVHILVKAYIYRGKKILSILKGKAE